MMRTVTIKGLITAGLLMMPLACVGQPHASKAHLAWTAHTCSVIAIFAGDATVSHELFNFGYQNTLEFIEDLQAGKITDKELREQAPIGFTMLLEGPNAEFVAGRIFQSILEEQGRKIYDDDIYIRDEELRQNRARTMFQEQNCNLVIR